MTKAQLVARIAELEAQLAAANAKIVAARTCYRELKNGAVQPVALATPNRSWIWTDRNGVEQHSTRIDSGRTSRTVTRPVGAAA